MVVTYEEPKKEEEASLTLPWAKYKHSDGPSPDMVNALASQLIYVSIATQLLCMKWTSIIPTIARPPNDDQRPRRGR